MSASRAPLAAAVVGKILSFKPIVLLTNELIVIILALLDFLKSSRHKLIIEEKDTAIV